MSKEVRILLVDDERDFAESMAFWLEARGFTTIVEHNCENALKMIKENAPDVIFLDIVMPGINGLTMLRMIREFNDDVPVIMMSSFIKDSKAEDEPRAYNVSGVFCKGDDLSKALHLIKSALKSES